MNRLRALVVVCLVSTLTGCALKFDTRSLGVPVTMAEPLAAGVVGDTFNVTMRAIHVFWGLAPAKEASLHQALAGQLGTGGGVHNLAIHARKRWSDVLFTALTLGFVTTTSVTFSGVITRGTP